jgi:ABC-type phosphate/phosphonate transport system substrate-binding protein
LDSDLTKAIEKFVEEQMKLVSNLKSCHFFEVGTNNDIHYYQLKWNTDTICKFQGTVVGVKPTVDEAQRNKLQEAINNVLKSMNKENNQKVNELKKNRKFKSEK